MSGGALVVLDRAGRAGKAFPLRAGAATLGSAAACDIRVMLPTVAPHHATVSVHYHQTVVRSVSERETLVNGVPVSVAALRHGDVISLGGRALRWQYRAPDARRAPPPPPEPALVRRVGRVGRARAPRRASDPAPRRVIVPEHRATMPASTSGKQVAIVQPQRRDTSDMSDGASPRLTPNKRPRVSRNGATPGSGEGAEPEDRAKRSSPRTEPNLANTTKATLWIESRKTSPRKSAAKAAAPVTPPPRRNVRKAVSAKKATPLRMVVLKKAQSVQKMKVTKIQAPLKMDSTKQAAIMLMARHTPKSKQPSPGKGRPSFVVKRPSPVRDTPRNRSSGKRGSSAYRHSVTSQNVSANRYPSVIEITDSETQSSIRESSVTRRSGKSSLQSPHLASPKKSALKDPNAKRGGRKTESIKFDLSNLDPEPDNRSSDVMLVNETENFPDQSETEFTLRYSDSSTSPSPRKSINSRSRRMLENSLGASVDLSPKSDRRTLTPESPRTKKSLRGSIILQEALRINKSDGTEMSSYSRRTTKSLSDQSWSTTLASARRTRTLSPRASRNNLESYSIVDLVSVDSNDSTASRSGSVYTSADSNRSATYDTPGSQNLTAVGRRALGCSTPYDPTSRPSSAGSRRRRKGGSAHSIANTSVTTPENSEDTTKSITLNSTKISRASKRRFRTITRKNAPIFMDDAMSEDDSSPKSSKRTRRGSQASPLVPKNISVNETFVSSPSGTEGMHTPENRHSPVEASTPVLNIQRLLDASQNSNRSPGTGGSRTSMRKTIAAVRSEPRRGRTFVKSKSLSLRRSGRGRDLASFEGSDDGTVNVEEEVVTPKSAAKPLPEGVKNKHSSAKKPLSKRSLIDNLNESDIVKELFNSPVKRKLSQSMTEFSRKHLFDDEDRPRRPTRATIAGTGTGRSPELSLMDDTERFTPEIFVSPLNTPRGSPNLSGIKRLFQKNTPENDLRDVRGVKSLLRTPRARRSTRNDLTDVAGVKAVFGKSPKDDLRRVSGVKNLFGSPRRKGKSPRNELDDLRGVRSLFRDDGPNNDLRNVSGVKRALQRNSPRNDLTDVRGVKRMFRLEKQRHEESNLSGVERLYRESANYDSTFDQLLGRPPIKAVYTKSKSFTAPGKVQKRERSRKSKSLHDLDLITNNVEEWLHKKLNETLHRKEAKETSISKGRKSLNKSRNFSRAMRELQKLSTNTVEGSAPVIVSRTRNSSIQPSMSSADLSQKKSASELYGAHMLPIKKRSLVAAVNRSNDRSHKLPIKKRAVVHSTPVRGRVNITMNASEIGRMSPISSEDQSTLINNVIRSPQRQVPAKTKSPPKPKAKTPLKEKSMEIAKASPKKTRSTKTAPGVAAPAKPRGRKSKPDNQEALNVKKRRSSIVITKKAPVLSPKPAPKATRKGKANVQEPQVPKTSPKRTRSTRGQKSQASVETKPTTPKRTTRAKATRASVIVTKPSPNLKPRGARSAAPKNISSPELHQAKPKRSRKVTITEPERQDDDKKSKQPAAETKVKGQGRRKPRKTVVEGELPAPVVDKSPIIQTRRSRKAAESVQAESTMEKSSAQAKRSRKVADAAAPEEAAGDSVPQPRNVRGRKRVVLPTTSKPKGRNGPEVAETKPAAPKGRNGPEVAETKPAARKGRNEPEVAETKPAAPKGRNGPEVAETKPTARKGRNEPEVAETKPTRGRRAKQVPAETSKSPTPAPPVEAPPGRGRKRKITERDDPGTKDIAGKKETRSITERDDPGSKDIAAKKETRATKKVGKEDKDTKNTTNAGKVKNARGGAGDASKLSKSVPAAPPAPPAAPRTRRAQVAAEEAKPKGKKSPQPPPVNESAPQAAGRKKRTNVEIADAKETKKEPTKKRRKAAVTPPAPRATRAGASRARRR